MSPAHPLSFHSSRRTTASLALAATLLVLTPRGARAESTIAYKFQDYAEDGGRVGVQAHYSLIEQTLGPSAKLKLTGVIDTITGATPTGQPAPTPDGAVPLTTIEERRKAWTADVSRQFSRINVALGAAHSRESDYLSTGLSLNTLTDFREKHTTLLFGIAGTRDEVSVFHQSDRADKETFDAILGVTQILGPRTSASLNFSYGRATGYLADPYKLIQRQTEVAPGLFLPLTFAENRPDERTKWIVLGSLNHTVERLKGAVEASYRYYDDDYGTTSHTLTTTWLQRLGPQLIFQPSVRFYTQGAADFYRVTLDGTAIVPGSTPNPAGPFFSADYRLARLQTWTLGAKLIWTPRADLQVDLAYERYEMRGRDSITSASAFPSADIITVGARYSW